MKETIYLYVTKQGVERMRKTFGEPYRNEIAVKLQIKVDESAFRPPVLEKEVYVNDWRKGIDMQDVEFREDVITEEEAELIRQKRLAKMEQILRAQGYTVTKEEETNEEHQ